MSIITVEDVLSLDETFNRPFIDILDTCCSLNKLLHVIFHMVEELYVY